MRTVNKFGTLLIFFILISLVSSSAQELSQPRRPKLVVGVVIDQMRYDYLEKFYNYFGDDGFKLLMNKGTNFTFVHYNYVPTNTAPGHSSIFTGTTPYYHGIINNDWFDRGKDKNIYCTTDDSVHGVGSDEDEGFNSPRTLMASTITDQIKLATGGLSKVIGISIKDRGAILPAGHMANAAYWYDHSNGFFISSSYYMEKLPDWVNRFNERKLADKYLANDWNLLLPLSEYKVCDIDTLVPKKDVFYEGETNFPHNFKNLKAKKFYGALPATPGGNVILKEFALELLKNEKLGKGNVTDFLTVSFSSTDYVGHLYGPNSTEVMDTYIRLDKDLGELIKALNSEIGADNYVLFLTADHAAVEVPELLEKSRIPAGRFDLGAMKKNLDDFGFKKYKTRGLISSLFSDQIYLNRELIDSLQLNLDDVSVAVKDYVLAQYDKIPFAKARPELLKVVPKREPDNLLDNSYCKTRSGEILFYFVPNHLYKSSGNKTSHGTPYNYDTHIPLLFYGKGIPAQEINSPAYIVDIAPTVANILGIQEPNCSIGIPLLKPIKYGKMQDSK